MKRIGNRVVPLPRHVKELQVCLDCGLLSTCALFFLRYSQGELALHVGRRERHEDRLGISDCPEAEGIFWA